MQSFLLTDGDSKTYDESRVTRLLCIKASRDLPSSQACSAGTVGKAAASAAVRALKVEQLTQDSHSVFWEKCTEQPRMLFLEGQLGTSDGPGPLTCPAAPSLQVLVDAMGG